jgi:hypothetical protein
MVGVMGGGTKLKVFLERFFAYYHVYKFKVNYYAHKTLIGI